jgi:FAD/FMN-containing dehydrogenase
MPDVSTSPEHGRLRRIRAEVDPDGVMAAGHPVPLR